ncbi:hypothetical protein GTW50_00135 [Streptomyces sp. SID7815]|nr:hypothetical protein [Streptomyces sp. SID7815]
MSEEQTAWHPGEIVPESGIYACDFGAGHHWSTDVKGPGRLGDIVAASGPLADRHGSGASTSEPVSHARASSPASGSAAASGSLSGPCPG